MTSGTERAIIMTTKKEVQTVQISIDKESRIPSYMQIYKAIRARIISGAFAHGSRLPSKRMLAEDCGVSVATIEHAYAMLCEEGYAEPHERSGYYVCYDGAQSFPARMEAASPLLSISALSDFHLEDVPFSSFAKRMRKVLSIYGERILCKSPNNGCPELREAIACYLARNRNIDVQPSQVIIGSGAEYLYGLCIQMLGRERLVALENPSYEKIRAVYAANGAVCEMLEMDSEGISSKALQETKASILHVTPFHSFPSGITASAKSRREYIAWAKARNAVIIEDDYDSEFILTGRAPETLFSLSPDANVIYLNTFSKTVAPSLRVGYMLLPPSLCELYAEKVGFYSCTVPMLEQYFLADLISSGDFERNISRIRHKHTKNNTV